MPRERQTKRGGGGGGGRGDKSHPSEERISFLSSDLATLLRHVRDKIDGFMYNKQPELQRNKASPTLTENSTLAVIVVVVVKAKACSGHDISLLQGTNRSLGGGVWGGGGGAKCSLL